MLVDCIEPKLGDVVITYYDGEYDENNPLTNSYEGHGVVNLDNGCIYDGNFKNGMFQGKGVFKWPNGVKFEGNFEYGNINGKGSYEWHEGSIYLGNVFNGLRHGNGKFVCSTGQTYEGEWKSGKRCGYGKLWYNEDRTVTYNGEWQNNMRHGYGIMKYSSGSIYEGEWEFDKKCGSGVMIWKNVDESYCGEWKNDLPDGLGEYIWGDGSSSRSMKKECCNIYRGNFENGKRQGKGTFFYMNGSQYTGDWFADEKHGEGVFIYPDGKIFGGMFQNNRMIPLDEESASNSRATESVNPQYCLSNIIDIYDYYPKLLTVGTNDLPNIEISDMERLLLKYNQYVRAALRRYTDFSNFKRLKDAQLQSQSLLNFSPVSRSDKVHKACSIVRAFHKRMFCMNLEQMLRFLREIGIVGGPFLRSYDVGVCLRKMRNATSKKSLDKLLEYRTKSKNLQNFENEVLEAITKQDTAMKALQLVDTINLDGMNSTDTNQHKSNKEEYNNEVNDFSLCTLMDGFLHPQSADYFFDIQSSQPLFDREVVELFVRVVAEWYIRIKDSTIATSQLNIRSDMSLKQVLYYVLAHKLFPLTTNFEENIPSFYMSFYNDDIQSLLIKSSSGINTEHDRSSLFFLKLWRYLCDNASSNIDFSQNKNSTVSGQPLSSMHLADNFETNILSGGYIQIRHLVTFFLSMQDSLILSSEASITDLLLNMNCMLITTISKQSVHSESSSEEKLSHDITPQSPEDLNEKKQQTSINETLCEIADFNCLSFYIDYYDYLEIMCRIISSNIWIYKAPVVSYTEGGDDDIVIDLSETKVVNDILKELDSNENISAQRLEELLYDRICAWTQSFNLDSFLESSEKN